MVLRQPLLAILVPDGKLLHFVPPKIFFIKQNESFSPYNVLLVNGEVQLGMLL